MTRAQGARSGAPPIRRSIVPLVALAAALSALTAWNATHAIRPAGEIRRTAALRSEPPVAPAAPPRAAPAPAPAEAGSRWIAGGRLRPEAGRLLAMIADARADGLDPSRFDLPGLRAAAAAARGGDPQALEAADRRLSAALAAYAVALRRPAEPARMAFVDPDLRMPPASPEAVLEAAAHAPSLARFLEGLRPSNPYYLGLRRALAEHRAARPPGSPPDPAERLILANMDRVRALPDALGERYVVVNVPEQTLWLYEHGRPVDSMEVVVGKTSEPTPAMAGLIRYAAFNPYWNVPADLARASIAPKVLAQGPGYLEERRFEVLSDWTAEAHRLDPAEVDWRAVADGRQLLRVRQTPGDDNMMGQMKFMLPNELGIYLHDTPLREAFRLTPRAASSGCVRLSDAPRLARRLLGRDTAPSAEAEARLDLERPVPVYILYLTARPEGGRLVRGADLYGRDPPLMRALAG